MMVGEGVGADVGGPTVIILNSLKATVVEVTSLKDLDMLCMYLRNDPTCIASFSWPCINVTPSAGTLLEGSLLSAMVTSHLIEVLAT